MKVHTVEKGQIFSQVRLKPVGRNDLRDLRVFSITFREKAIHAVSVFLSRTNASALFHPNELEKAIQLAKEALQ